ncbi:MAG: family 20 glycosylhydrolase [Clostridium baratii]|uniref:beta-N-acetylhexosaminidase n=1 Tax=Clostridium baratii TaxID=1561 RepID=UPI0006BED665|nr:glycoside hydrolase family 20 zincin-like fold domain-containing protein [Clostridium baratii]MBS6007083.1 family 20 glycosylhydrolase [Clostridium baratii]MDU1054164.1 glycoside hydrolase family 20 zincin-like fold domain-containing protein [Clostridium baratii]MDU4910962.1 glycoside hydrolase family 20 zincin-like fold domain-containing protein [Clostridium baratii]CUP52168.1 glycosyl hydrolase family protein [Clostridium baratii]
MYLIPRPKEYKETLEQFIINKKTKIVLSNDCTSNELETALMLKEAIKDESGITLNITKSFKEGYSENEIRIIIDNLLEKEEYKLNIKDKYIEIIGSESSGVYYGIQTLIQILKQDGIRLRGINIEDSPYFKNRGYFADITRGKVPSLESLKKLADKLSFYKVNQMQLYIEHTFAFKDMSEVWRDKDPITAEEILILDEYCKKRHIELIPSLATFGHLYEVLRTKSYEDLCELENSRESEYSYIDRMAHHTLDVSNNKSLELVYNMLKEFIPLFSSNKFNICCDETFDLGKGKSKDIAEEIGSGKLYVDFLNKVISFVKKYNKTVLFWGDVILNHKELLKDIPEDTICLNWDYWCKATENNTRTIWESNRKQWVCPGTGGWSHLMNLIENSFENINRMVSYGVKYGAGGILNTDWGDYGHINSFSNSVPSIIYGASLSWNPNIEKDFDYEYKAISLLEYGDESLQLVNVLKELSECQTIGWSELIWWKERYNDKVKADFKKLDTYKIKESYEKAKEVEERLLILSTRLKNKEFIEEFILSANGIALINDFFLTLLKEEFNKNEVATFNTPKNLARYLEEWLYDYSVKWRENNKESELYRIRDVIIYVCDYLRDIKG